MTPELGRISTDKRPILRAIDEKVLGFENRDVAVSLGNLERSIRKLGFNYLMAQRIAARSENLRKDRLCIRLEVGLARAVICAAIRKPMR